MNDVYILKSDINYIIISNSKEIINLSEETYKKYCFELFETFFCKEIPANTLDCDSYYINKRIKKFYKECFTKLPNQNMITQVGRDIYFTVFHPMEVFVKFNTSSYSINILQSSKLINQKKYILNTTFFQFDPNDSPKFETFSENNGNNSYVFYSSIFLSKDYIILFEILFILIIFKIIDLVCFLCCKRRIYIRDFELIDF